MKIHRTVHRPQESALGLPRKKGRDPVAPEEFLVCSKKTAFHVNPKSLTLLCGRASTPREKQIFWVPG